MSSQYVKRKYKYNVENNKIPENSNTKYHLTFYEQTQ